MSIYGKVKEFVLLFVFITFLLLFKCSSINNYMVFTTRSSAKSESMSDISEEIQKYFSELIKPLATNTSLKEMFDKMSNI